LTRKKDEETQLRSRGRTSFSRKEKKETTTTGEEDLSFYDPPKKKRGIEKKKESIEDYRGGKVDRLV